jgi:hypothetical protein
MKRSRTVHVTKIGEDLANDCMRYRVEIGGSDNRTFEVLVPLSTTVAKGPREQAIKRLYAHGRLPLDGSVTNIGDVGR